MSEDSKIPDGWEMVFLDELVIRMTNGANVTQYEEKVGFPISRIETIWNEKIDFGRVKYIKEHDRIFVEKYRLYDNDILFSHINSDAHLGKTAIFKSEKTNPLIHGINLLLIRPSQEISSDFLNYQFKYLRAKGAFAAVAQKAVNQSSINQAKLKAFHFLLPPHPEQYRIVAKIEELFSELDKGIESLKTAQHQLKVYRQAVLKWAFEGRLTNETVEKGKLPTGWKKEPLKEISFVNPKLPIEIADDTEVSFLPMRLVEEIINKIHLTEFKHYKNVKKGFTPMADGDVIFAKITPCMENGKIALVHSLKNGIAFGSTEFHVFRCKAGVSNYYLFHYLVQERTRKDAESNMTGAVGQRRVPKSFLENLLIPLPPTVKEQSIIVAEIESRLSVCDKIEESIITSLKQAEALRQSILKKAFEGKLVPQNHKDEPASKLLERIKAEREKSSTSNKPKSQKT